MPIKHQATDWKPYRTTRAEWPSSTEGVYGLLITELLAAFGIPNSLSPVGVESERSQHLSEGHAPVVRSDVLRSLAVKIEAELSRVLPDKINLTFQRATSGGYSWPRSCSRHSDKGR